MILPLNTSKASVINDFYGPKKGGLKFLCDIFTDYQPVMKELSEN